MEQLDHRQLLSVNFTGNVLTDFPETTVPGVVVLTDNPGVRHPLIPPDVAPVIRVSGLDINGIRVSYSLAQDELSIGLQQPENQKTGQFVIAGDVDNNLDGATVDPAVEALRPGEFIDFGFLGGSETMGAFLDLDGDTVPDIVAGISNDVGQPKLYQVSQAAVNPDPGLGGTIPAFGAPLPANTGRAFLSNDPAAPNFEFSITNFSQLFLAETGQALTPDRTIRVGAFGNSNDDDGITEAFFPPQGVNVGTATVPVPVPPEPPPVICPPVSPPIKINPHELRHIDTAHRTRIRGYVFGTSGFDVTQIIPETVRLGGAAPISTLIKRTNRDAFPDATFTFRGTDVVLPPGFTSGTLTGTLRDGTTFSSTVEVFNRDRSFFTPAEIAAQAARFAAASRRRAATTAAADVARAATPRAASSSAAPVVVIPKRKAANTVRNDARPSGAAPAHRRLAAASRQRVTTTASPVVTSASATPRMRKAAAGP